MRVPINPQERIPRTAKNIAVFTPIAIDIKIACRRVDLLSWEARSVIDGMADDIGKRIPFACGGGVPAMRR